MELTSTQVKDVVLGYLDSSRRELAHLDTLNGVLKESSPDSSLFELTPVYVRRFINDFVKLLMTKEQFDILEWWLYECKGKAKVSDESGEVTLTSDAEFYDFFLCDKTAQQIKEERKAK